MRISDWSSDVCSSDLPALHRRQSFKLDGEHLAGVDGQPRLPRPAAEGNVLDRRRAIDPRAFDARRNADDVTRRAGLADAALIGATKRADRKSTRLNSSH